jgi:hypothetical protein
MFLVFYFTPVYRKVNSTNGDHLQEVNEREYCVYSLANNSH